MDQTGVVVVVVVVVNSRKGGREVRRRERAVERGGEGEGRVMLVVVVERVVGRFDGGGEVGGQMVVLRMGVDWRDWRKDWRTDCWGRVRLAGGWGMPGEKVVY